MDVLAESRRTLLTRFSTSEVHRAWLIADVVDADGRSLDDCETDDGWAPQKMNSRSDRLRASLVTAERTIAKSRSRRGNPARPIRTSPHSRVKR